MPVAKTHSKRYLLCLMPDMFLHLEELATVEANRTGQYITVASLIRDAIQKKYPMTSKEKQNEN
jgi:hypothetical protein